MKYFIYKKNTLRCDPKWSSKISFN